MGEIRLFHVIYGGAHELVEAPFDREKELQHLFEAQLSSLTGVDFLATEYPAGRYGRIDTLGIDARGKPVVIEYKRSQNANIINQGIHYLEWLQDHQADIKLLVRDAPRVVQERHIDFGGARLLCVAWDFTNWDRSTAKGFGTQVELLRCRRYRGESGSNLLLEWVWPENVSSLHIHPPVNPPRPDIPHVIPQPPEKLDLSTNEQWNRSDKEMRDFFAEFREVLETFGNDVRIEARKRHIGFLRTKIFASAVLMTGNRSLHAYVKLDPSTVQIEPGFTRDMRGIGHWGTGDLQINIRSRADLEKAKPLLRDAYENS